MGADNIVNGPNGPHTDCERHRTLISARADGAVDPTEARSIEVHLERCDDCASYAHDVGELARMTRLRPVSADHAFVERVMSSTAPVRLGRGGWMRPALAWCALVTFALGIPPLVLGEIDGSPSHVARHVGASTVALGIGLLVVAWRPSRAIGMLPFAAALFGAMVVGAALDLVSGSRSLASELLHLVELTGVVLLWLIAGSPGVHRLSDVSWPFGRRRVAARSTT